MAAVDWPTGPRDRLPRTTPPFTYETVASYVARLAHANHLQAGELRRYLTEPRASHPRPDWLATVSGYPVPVLQSRLKGLAENERNLTRQRVHSRPSCRFCMARRSVDEPVYCWLPEHVTVCYRHRRWIGPPARMWADQHSLADKPAVIAAARRHARLQSAHVTIEFDLRDARRILAGWALHHSPNNSTTSRAETVEAHISTYPQLIALAGILAAYRHRIWTSVSAETSLAQALHGLHCDITDCLHIRDTPSQMPAIDVWADEQQIIAAARPRRNG
jgi:TniQ